MYSLFCTIFFKRKKNVAQFTGNEKNHFFCARAEETFSQHPFSQILMKHNFR